MVPTLTTEHTCLYSRQQHQGSAGYWVSEGSASAFPRVPSCIYNFLFFKAVVPFIVEGPRGEGTCQPSVHPAVSSSAGAWKPHLCVRVRAQGGSAQVIEQSANPCFLVCEAGMLY